MPRAVRFGALAAVALIIVLATAVLVLFDPATHKARVEAVASHALGMQVTVGGALALRWRPGAHLVLEDVHARKRGADVIAARQVRIGIEPLSLLRDEPQVYDIVLQDAVLAVERDRDGRFNFERDDASGSGGPARNLPDVSFTGSTFTYADARFDARMEGRACRGDVRRIQLAGAGPSLMARLSFAGELGCGAIHMGNLAASEVTLAADARQGLLELKPIGMRLFGVRASSRVKADYTGAAPAYQVEHVMRQLPVEALLNSLSLKPVASGRIDLTASLSMQGRAEKEIQRSMQGRVSLRGQGLTFHGADLDAQFERFESSQSFSLVDVGAVFLAGPLGLLVTKGYDFATISQGTQGGSEIRSLVSDWTVERGIAHADDVALATKANRVALKGSIDLANDRFDDTTIALIDDKGCVKVQQPIRGTLQKPVLEKPSAIKALTGPVVSLLKKGTELLGNDRCDVYYAGSVAAPK